MPKKIRLTKNQFTALQMIVDSGYVLHIMSPGDAGVDHSTMNALAKKGILEKVDLVGRTMYRLNLNKYGSTCKQYVTDNSQE